VRCGSTTRARASGGAAQHERASSEVRGVQRRRGQRIVRYLSVGEQARSSTRASEQRAKQRASGSAVLGLVRQRPSAERGRPA
jgi:hypothetical protein